MRELRWRPLKLVWVTSEYAVGGRVAALLRPKRLFSLAKRLSNRPFWRGDTQARLSLYRSRSVRFFG